MRTSLKPRGFVHIEVLDQNDNIIQVIDKENFITWQGVKAIATNLVTPESRYTIGSISYGDGYVVGVTPPPDLTSLYAEKGNAVLKSNVVQSILEPSLSLLFQFDGESLSETLLLNELGMRTKEGKLFSFISLEGDSIIELEKGKRVNVTWKLQW